MFVPLSVPLTGYQRGSLALSRHPAYGPFQGIRSGSCSYESLGACSVSPFWRKLPTPASLPPRPGFPCWQHDCKKKTERVREGETRYFFLEEPVYSSHTSVTKCNIAIVKHAPRASERAIALLTFQEAKTSEPAFAADMNGAFDHSNEVCSMCSNTTSVSICSGRWWWCFGEKKASST